MTRPVHVMVAILRDRAGRILITSRPSGKQHAGRWEFPGGKLEDCESPEACLRRELLEELGVVAGPMQPLIQLEHAYPELTVRLDVREVRFFGGETEGREGQSLKWVMPDDLPYEDILEADRPIIQALRLPEHCLVTPDAAQMDTEAFLQGLRASLDSGLRLVQFRSPQLQEDDYVALARQVADLCHSYGAKVLLNADPRRLCDVKADGIHLTSRRLAQLHARPVPSGAWLTAACHTTSQLAHAMQVGVDFVFASPVLRTPSHSDALPLGWSGFRVLTARGGLPVYALGGMRTTDAHRARELGGHGVAGIRGFWKGRVD